MIISLLLIVLCCCEQPGPVKEKVELSLSVPKTTMNFSAGSQFIEVDANVSWTLTLEFEEGENPWAKLSKTSGSGSQTGIILSWEENKAEQRICKILLQGGEESDYVVITQSATAIAPPPPVVDPGEEYTGVKEDPKVQVTALKADAPGPWLELPALNNPNYYFIYHSMKHKDKLARSWSFYYDPVSYLAMWVAYPLNADLIGSGGRTDEWGYDPKVPRDRQQVLKRGYYGYGYDRGHQLPSADRLNRDDNVKTFYYTNMTPQASEFNQKAWADLESKVRTWCRQVDTLYVVTGTDIVGYTETVNDNEGNAIPIPVGYFKALLAYKKTLQKYYAIAFYFENEKYTGNIMNASMSVGALEEKLGYDFFVNLPNVVGADAANSIESHFDLDMWK